MNQSACVHVWRAARRGELKGAKAGTKVCRKCAAVRESDGRS